MPKRETVTIVEVGPRDGLQNEPNFVPTDSKINLINQLSECGFRKIEVTSFVSSKWIPQLADAGAVMDKIERRPDVIYSALTPNLKGLDAAIAHGADEVAIFASASEGFSKKNINCTIAESLERFAPVAKRAREFDLPMRGYVSTILDCPYSGVVNPDQVVFVAEALLRLGCTEISLGDTLGKGTPDRVEKVLDCVLQYLPAKVLAGHFHDTDGHAVENIELSLSKGIRTFDASIAGLGGCPYAPGAKGNVATETVCDFLEKSGFDTGIDRKNSKQ